MSKIKDLARSMTRAGALPRSTRPRRSTRPAPQPPPPVTEAPTPLPFDPPQSWAPPAPVAPSNDDPRTKIKAGRPAVDEAKRRSARISVSVSKEESNILRAAANDAGMSLSEWIRRVLFGHIGKALPKRPHT